MRDPSDDHSAVSHKLDILFIIFKYESVIFVVSGNFEPCFGIVHVYVNSQCICTVFVFSSWYIWNFCKKIRM